MLCENCPYDDKNERFNNDQLEYLWCDKVGGKHYAYGYCNDYDNYDDKYQNNLNKQRKQKGRTPPTKNSRRYYKQLKDKRLKNIIKRNNHYAPNRGYFQCKYNPEINEFIEGSYIKFPKNSNRQKWIKKMTSHKIRHMKDVPNHNGYRKYIDYKWILY